MQFGVAVRHFWDDEPFVVTNRRGTKGVAQRTIDMIYRGQLDQLVVLAYDDRTDVVVAKANTELDYAERIGVRE
jgi:hypothetical protein